MGHGIIWWIVVGLIAGALAKAITPGTDREPKGCLMTMGLGLAGSLLVGWVVEVFLGGGSGGFVPSIIGATIGAILLILLMRKFWK
jgi:uncharacterized membrane protein YeaQ/YmgE (transglycosylase-associated protein family)